MAIQDATSAFASARTYFNRVQSEEEFNHFFVNTATFAEENVLVNQYNLNIGDNLHLMRMEVNPTIFLQ